MILQFQSLLLCLYTFLMVMPLSSYGQPNAMFQDIIASDTTAYEFYQIKITYTSIQSKTTPTLLLTGVSRSADISEFSPFSTSGIHYKNDSIAFLRIFVTGSTIDRIMRGIQDDSNLTLVSGNLEPALSLMIQKGQSSNVMVFEHLCDAVEAEQLLYIVEGAMRNESLLERDGLRKFRNFAVGQH